MDNYFCAMNRNAGLVVAVLMASKLNKSVTFRLNDLAAVLAAARDSVFTPFRNLVGGRSTVLDDIVTKLTERGILVRGLEADTYSFVLEISDTNFGTMLGVPHSIIQAVAAEFRNKVNS